MPALAVFIFCLFCVCPGAFAHGNHPNGPLVQARPANEAQARAFRLIGKGYAERVEPIFEKKCFDCHANSTHYPWYYRIPGVKQYINYDIREAHQHLDFSKGYPFVSHASPADDLDAIHDEIDEGDMPPWDYRLMHSCAALTSVEKQTVFSWVEQGESELHKAGL